jgi:DNA primase
MSLPPTFLDELRARLSLAQVVGRKVTWEARKTNRAKGDFWAPCPFHQEKTASFHVDDKKGYYYCFGCHAKGDAISFVRETENVGFMEAIEILAREAGMPMPARDPEAAAKADRLSKLSEAVEAAIRHYRLQLKTGAAAAAREYLARRKLSEAALDRFEIGFAPDARQGLFQALTAKGFAPDLLVEAGLCARPEEGGEPYDRFRGRIIFPIRDPRGRAISLGGRAMDANARAKYLNGPETELFDKGRSLFNHAPAREAAGKGQTLIVAEGYMDVIALVMGGFEAAVAPLGTAITEDQLRLLWRIHPEPVVALDGDRAGLGAAMRLIDLALPLIEARQSLRFALLPGGKDPDDLIRDGGPAAMRSVIEAARPMVELLWRRETEGKLFDSPERRTALDKRLREALRAIRDPALRGHYGEAVKALRAELFAPARRPGPRKPGRDPRFSSAMPMMGTRGSILAAGTARNEESLREAAILAVLLHHPGLFAEFQGDLEEMACEERAREVLRQSILRHAEDCGSAELFRRIAEEAPEIDLDAFLADPHLRLLSAIRDGASEEAARTTLAELFAKRWAALGLSREIAEAEIDMGHTPDEGLTWRLREAGEAHQRALKAGSEDRTEYDTAPTGARVSRAERAAFDRLLAEIGEAPRLPRGKER